MKTIGHDLAVIRIHQNLTLDDIHRATRISVETLKKIEDGSIFTSKEENNTYIRSFVRAYAKALKIDEELTIRALDQFEAGTYEHLLLEPFPKIIGKGTLPYPVGAGPDSPSGEGAKGDAKEAGSAATGSENRGTTAPVSSSPGSMKGGSEAGTAASGKPAPGTAASDIPGSEAQTERIKVSSQKGTTVASTTSGPSAAGSSTGSTAPASASGETGADKPGVETGADKPVAEKRDASQSEDAQPGAEKRDTAQSDTAQSDAAQPGDASEGASGSANKPRTDWAEMGKRFYPNEKNSSPWLIVVAAVVVIALAIVYLVTRNSDLESALSEENLSETVGSGAESGLNLDLDTPVEEPPPPPALDDTLYLTIYAAHDKLDPVRVWADLKPRVDAYWLEQGEAWHFEFADTIRITGQHNRMLLFLNGHLIENPRQNHYNTERSAVELTRSLFEEDPRWASEVSLQLPEGVSEPDSTKFRPIF